MGWLIDTNIAIHARDGNAAVLERLAAATNPVLLSALSLAELQRGLFRDPHLAALRRERLEILLRPIPVLPFDAEAALAYGSIIAQIGWVRGRDFDRMIAAQALAGAHVLATRNVKDFRDIPGLALQDWSEARTSWSSPSRWQG